METIILYRAGDSGILTGAASFSTDLETARAYLDNPGFGGRTIYRAAVAIDEATVLDIRSESDAEQVRTIMEAASLDREFGAVTADFLLAQEQVIEALIEAGYEWVKLIDTFPVGAETYTWLYSGDEPELEECE